MCLCLSKSPFHLLQKKIVLSKHKYLLKYQLLEYSSTFLCPEFVDVPTGWLKAIDPYLMRSSFQLLNQEMKVVLDGKSETREQSVTGLSTSSINLCTISISIESNKNIGDHIKECNINQDLKELKNNQDLMHHILTLFQYHDFWTACLYGEVSFLGLKIVRSLLKWHVF